MPNDNIMGIPTKACVNGITKADALEIKKIPTLESETTEIVNNTIPSLDNRITALEQGGSGGIEYEWNKIINDDILEYIEHDQEMYFFNTDMILNIKFLTGTINYDNLTRPYYFNIYQKIFFKNEYLTDYYADMPIEMVKDYIMAMILFYYAKDIPISLPKQDSNLKAIGIVYPNSDPTFNSQSNYYEQTIKGYIIINDTNLTFKEITGKIVFESFSIYAYVERK